MGFALEHHIKFTSGVGVNGGGAHLLPLSQNPWRPVDQRASISSNPLSLGLAASKQMGQDPAEERWEVEQGSSRERAIITPLCCWEVTGDGGNTAYKWHSRI